VREPDRQSLSRWRRAERFQAHHFARDVFTEDVIFYELINRELLDYPARNAECFYASTAGWYCADQREIESPQFAGHARLFATERG
jgi:hypothetical protein